MGVRVDMSTVLLLFAPLFLPRIYSFVAQAIARMGHKAASSPATSRAGGQQAQAPKITVLTAAFPAIIVALYSLYLLTLGRPFNFFSSLGQIPLFAPTAKIQAALTWSNVSEKYGDDLALLTSLDIRALYLHFGHENLVGCHRLLGSTTPKDILAYTSVTLARAYIIRALLLAYANRRWKNSILLASVAGALYEIYTLATTDIRLPQRDAPTEVMSLWNLVSFYRNVTFICASVLVIVLPSRQPAKPLSAEEASLMQGVQALIQRQDMLQTRIRVIEAAISPIVKKESPSMTSHLSPTQKDSLKAWLRTIIGDAAGGTKSVPAVKIEEIDDAFIPPIVKKEDDDDEADAAVKAMQLPKSESFDIMEESFATAQVVIKRSNSEDSLLSPPLSRSSSNSSSPIDTPTPAMRRPMSMEINGAAASHLRQLMGSGKDEDEDEEAEADVDQPLNKRKSFTNRLTQSLGPSGPVSHPNVLPVIEITDDRPHRRSFSMYGVIPGIREPDEKASEPTSTELAPVDVPTEAPESSVPTDASMQQPEAMTGAKSAMSDRPHIGASIHATASPPNPTMHLVAAVATHSDSNDSTPNSSQIEDDDGWTTVYSKKAKNRT